MKQLIFDYNPFCVRVALVCDGELLELSVERAGIRGIVGNIYKGKVENVISGMHAAFVNIGLERNGFLYCGDSLVEGGKLAQKREPASVSVTPGDVIMCQIVKDQFGQKGARLTTDISLPGFYLVLLPDSEFIGVSRKIEDTAKREYLEEFVKANRPPNTGFIVRSAADKASVEDLEREMRTLTDLWEKVEKDYRKASEKTLVFEEEELFRRAIRDTFNEELDQIVVNDSKLLEILREDESSKDLPIQLYSGKENIFVHYRLDKQIEALADHRVDLENGAYLIIDKTEALTVIDVNTGRYVGSKNLEDTVFKTNLAAADGIAKTLRKRNIGGIIVVDFIDMTEQAHRDAVVEYFREELKKDRMKTSAVEMTALGLMELTRKKVCLPADSFLLEKCDLCDGGYTLSREYLTIKLRDALTEYMLKHDECKIYAVTANPDVLAAAVENKYLSCEIEKNWPDKKIYSVSDASYGRTRFEFGCFKDESSLPEEAVILPKN